MVESSEPAELPLADEFADSIEEEKAPPRRQNEKKEPKEKELTEEELEAIAKGKQIFHGEVSNALQDSQAKKGSNSVSVTSDST